MRRNCGTKPLSLEARPGKERKGQSMAEMYTIGDAAEKLGMPASTIRFYEKNGLVPNMRRTGSGIRLFDDEDLEWMRFVERLKASGMPIKEIRRFVELYQQGDATIAERRRIIHERRKVVERRIAELELARDFIEYKCWFYDVAAEAGTCDVPREMPPEEMSERMLRIKERCGLNRY